MILKESRELEWIQQLRIRYPYTNPTLIEKAIRAFSLLEALAVSGCPFVFKGGTALMLHMNSAKRISIDVDIICEPGTDVIGYLNKTAQAPAKRITFTSDSRLRSISPTRTWSAAGGIMPIFSSANPASRTAL